MVRISLCLATTTLAILQWTVSGLPADGDTGTLPEHHHHHHAHAHAHAKRLLLDSLTTPVQTTGEHEFIAPDFEAGDQRGPCPGLNALANHGYISRDGVTGLVEVTTAINSVYGMGLELATILATLGTVFVGDPISLNPGFSIGAVDPGVENLLDNGLTLLGTPRGLVGSHNIIESDSSMTRPDLYVTGDASTMDIAQFKTIYDMLPDEPAPAFDIMARRAYTRFNESVNTNPNFYYGPFTGMVARNAGYFFSARFFANYSSTTPEGLMCKSMLNRNQLEEDADSLQPRTFSRAFSLSRETAVT